MIDVEVDINSLQRRLSPLGALDVRPLAGGASSLSFVARVGDQRVVVKVAPAGLEPVRNRDVLRQARLLRALAGSGVPVPVVLHEDPGDPPAVPPLFVMSFVEGTSLEPFFDTDGSDTPDEVGARLREAARVLADLHAVGPDSVDLGDEPAVRLSDEVHRWIIALDTVDETLAPGWREVANTLLSTAPAAVAPSIVHGDFRLGNLLATGRAVRAIIDWEIWCLGDPRIDLGWFLINADPSTYGRATPYVGLLPSPYDLRAEYLTHRGVEMPADEWFRGLALFKATATWALIVKHARRRRVVGAAEAMAAHLPRLLEQAATQLTSASR